MSQTIFIKPAKGLKVRLENKPQEFLPEAGDEKPRNAYWVRRVNDGSVIEAKAPKKTGSK